MKIGLVGYQGSGKSTLFEWLTGVKADPALAHTTQSAMAPIPDPRVEPLCKIYQPKKITLASLEIVDTPGLSRSQEGNPARLAVLREAGCIVLVVSGFGGIDPLADLKAFEEDLLLADLEIVSGRVQRLEESSKKPRPREEREQQEHEITALRILLSTLEEGKAAQEAPLNDEQRKHTRAFRLLTEKPKMVLINLADDDTADRFPAPADANVAWAAVPVRLQLDLAAMAEDERKAFQEEFGLAQVDRDAILRQIMSASGQMLYFTAGEKEVRTWLLHQGGTALEAADNIHSDLARGFIRAETMHCDDLIRLGSEREIKAAGLMRQEPKDYVVKDGDILHIKFSV